MMSRPGRWRVIRNRIDAPAERCIAGGKTAADRRRGRSGGAAGGL